MWIISITQSGEPEKIQNKKVLAVPDIGSNLLSIKKITEAGCEVILLNEISVSFEKMQSKRSAIFYNILFWISDSYISCFPYHLVPLTLKFTQW